MSTHRSRRLVHRGVSKLEQVRDGVHTETIHAFLQPELQHFLKHASRIPVRSEGLSERITDTTRIGG